MENIPTSWPVVGSTVGNPWNVGLSEFVALLDRHRGFWAADFDLKYLNIRVDTRSNYFVLSDRDGNHISADRVLTAIHNYRNSFRSMVDEKTKKK